MSGYKPQYKDTSGVLQDLPIAAQYDSEGRDISQTYVEKIPGKGLSTEDFTTVDKNKLEGIEDGAQVNVQADWKQTDPTAADFIKNKPNISDEITPDMITAGLPNQVIITDSSNSVKWGSVKIDDGELT